MTLRARFLAASGISPGAVPSPNIWEHPALYEVENRALDPDGVIDAAISELARTPEVLTESWGHVLDIGCGTGYHLPRLAARAATVTGIEPHAGLLATAVRRVDDLPHVMVRQGTAQALPVPDRSVDLVHARWAYFFGPGCEVGLREVARVLRPGGLAVILDHDATRSQVGAWFAAGLRADNIAYDPRDVEEFWARAGFARRPLDLCWRFENEAELAAVLRIEFPAGVAGGALAEVRAARAGAAPAQGWEVSAAVNLWHRRY
ncbi:MAG: class I SAM-dependent methyltransferase [Sporichthyaceae bacterium]